MPMPALPSHPRRPAPEAHTNTAACASLEERWDALQCSADEIAALADLSPHPSNPDLSDPDRSAPQQPFELTLKHADERAVAIAERGVEDMELLAKTGLKALKQVQARGKPVQAPALALWRELYHAREAVLLVLEPVPA